MSGPEEVGGGGGHKLFACPKREGQHKFDTTNGWVTINFTACQE